MGEIVFNGISSTSLGLVVERVPNMDRPERKYDRYSVPGRNGDIFVMQDAWENVEQTYDIWWEDSISATVAERGYTLSEWLFGPSDYATLTDDFDPDHYRKAVFLGPYDVENTMQKLGRARITFDCDPRRFLNSGLNWININSGAYTYITNPTPFVAKPVVELEDSTATGHQIRVENGADASYLTIAAGVGSFIADSSRESIMYSDGTPAFASVSGTYPLLWPGENELIIYGYFDSAKIQPNWWTL